MSSRCLFARRCTTFKLQFCFLILLLVHTLYPLNRGLPKTTSQTEKPTTSKIDTLISSTRLQDVLQDLVVVSGYWRVEGNPKHNYSFYEEHVPDTLKYLDSAFSSVVFHHNLPSTSTLLNKKSNTTIDIIYQPTNELLWKEAQGLVALCEQQQDQFMKCPKFGRDKARKHYQRLKDSNTHVWTQIVTIWISKFHILQRALQKYPNKKYFAWLDGGLMGRIPEWLNEFVPNTYLDDNHVMLRSSHMCFNGTTVPFRAGVIAAAREPLAKLIHAFHAEIQQILKGNERPHMCYDEEMIIARVVQNDQTIAALMKAFYF